jgi:hypothetical protein
VAEFRVDVRVYGEMGRDDEWEFCVTIAELAAEVVEGNTAALR